MTTEVDVFVPTPGDLASIAELVWVSFVDGEICPAPSAHPGGGESVVATVAISGAWNGHVLVSSTPPAARRMAAAMFGHDDGAADGAAAGAVSDDEVADAFGEIANILGGNVKSLLPEPSVLSLPQVVLDTRAVRMPSAVQRAHVDLVWDGEPVNISVWEGPTAHDGGK